MRTNIVIDDKLMADVMGMRRMVYDGLRALRGKLQGIGDDETAWAKYREEQMAKVQARAAGLPFEGEIDTICLEPGFQLHVQSAPSVQESMASYAPAVEKAP